jgi:methylmalonyl-CoA mutase cobalamin-binding domain/chain
MLFLSQRGEAVMLHPAQKIASFFVAKKLIPAQDYDFLYQAGVKGIYGPGTPIPASAKDVLEQIRAALTGVAA